MPTEVAPPPPAPALAPPPPRRRTGRNFLVVLVLLIAAFFGGYVPQWLEARQLRADLQKANTQLWLTEAHDALGKASVESQRNNYASAAEAARRFFDQASSLAQLPVFAAEPRTQTALLVYAAQRDEVLALLAAADPAARERLAGLYLAMGGVIERRAVVAEE
jgi:hypothetical protein